jgi:hypothetical protein
MDRSGQCTQQFSLLDERIAELEAAMSDDSLGGLSEVLGESEDLVAQMLRAFGEYRQQPMPAESDLLELLKAFVKGEPSLNAVRDNVRELVFYRNCLNDDRSDALPPKAERMAVRTCRHIYLYLRTRFDQMEQAEA